MMELPAATCRKTEVNNLRQSTFITDAAVPLEASSAFRHGGLRDDRRRRLLTDDLSESDDVSSCRVWSDDDVPQKPEYYGNAQFLDRQWRLLDLVPQRLLVTVILLLMGIGIIAGLETTYAWTIQRLTADQKLATALDIGAKGSLTCWFASLTLLAASFAALLVYTVRRYRTDDYQGRYRVWIWAAVCWFLMATDQAASLREGFRELMIRLTGTPVLGDGTFWWVAVYVLLFLALGSRLLLDVRPNRLAITALAAAAVSYSLALTCHLGWKLTGTAAGDVMLRTGSEMVGQLMLFATMVLHARYVLRDAQGLVPHPEPIKKAEPEKQEPEKEEVKVVSLAADRRRAISPPHPAPPAAPHRPAPAPTAAAKPAPAVPFTPPQVNRKLTKAERRALKDRLLREREEREKKKW